MKVRVESQGIHYYCRRTGTHILFDEIKTNPSLYSKATRTISIAITDECDFSCAYCYVNLKDRYLPKEVIITLCKQLDYFGTFDVALGGGEPTLHPELVEICKRIWTETQLGISITTHGHNLSKNLVEDIRKYTSFIRVSIDGKEPVYSQLRKKAFSNLEPNLKILKDAIPFGINTVVNKLTVNHLDDVKSIFEEYGAFELLLLPMWNKGKFVLSKSDWEKLERWINDNYKYIPIRISSPAKQYLSSKFLFNEEETALDYGFIGIDQTLRKNSFTNTGLQIANYPSFESLLQEFATVGS